MQARTHVARYEESHLCIMSCTLHEQINLSLASSLGQVNSWGPFQPEGFCDSFSTADAKDQRYVIQKFLVSHRFQRSDSGCWVSEQQTKHVVWVCFLWKINTSKKLWKILENFFGNPEPSYTANISFATVMILVRELKNSPRFSSPVPFYLILHFLCLGKRQNLK